MAIIYCAWVDSLVSTDLLMSGCHQFITKDGRCVHCERSLQLNYGVTPNEILTRAKEE